MRVTGDGMRAVREMTGSGMHDIRRAISAAEEHFHGDILLGLGYVEAASFAVYRGEGDRRHRSLVASAEAWAARRRSEPEWIAMAAHFAANSDEPTASDGQDAEANVDKEAVSL